MVQSPDEGQVACPPTPWGRWSRATEGHRAGVDLESTAAELYGLDPGEFVAARTAAEKRARADGDRELATRLKALPKPTAAAWIANQLVRQHPDEIAGLRELGAGLREATATLEREQLRSLSQQQNRVIAALVAQGRALAKAAGHAMSEATERGLDSTLRAALADEDLAAQLAEGQLSTPLEHVGFAGAVAGTTPTPARKPQTPPRDELKERRRRAQVERAQTAVREARTAQRQASTALEHAETGLERAEAAVAEAKAAVQEAERERKTAKQARDKAKAAESEASQAVDAAQGELTDLTDPSEAAETED
jgi:hypothetical protein